MEVTATVRAVTAKQSVVEVFLRGLCNHIAGLSTLLLAVLAKNYSASDLFSALFFIQIILTAMNDFFENVVHVFSTVRRRPAAFESTRRSSAARRARRPRDPQSVLPRARAAAR